MAGHSASAEAHLSGHSSVGRHLDERTECSNGEPELKEAEEARWQHAHANGHSIAVTGHLMTDSEHTTSQSGVLHRLAAAPKYAAVQTQPQAGLLGEKARADFGSVKKDPDGRSMGCEHQLAEEQPQSSRPLHRLTPAEQAGSGGRTGPQQSSVHAESQAHVQLHEEAGDQEQRRSQDGKQEGSQQPSHRHRDRRQMGLESDQKCRTRSTFPGAGTARKLGKDVDQSLLVTEGDCPDSGQRAEPAAPAAVQVTSAGHLPPSGPPVTHEAVARESSPMSDSTQRIYHAEGSIGDTEHVRDLLRSFVSEAERESRAPSAAALAGAPNTGAASEAGHSRAP